MSKKLRTGESLEKDGYVKVVFSADVDEDTDECPQCGGDYVECDCPGPTMDGYDYEVSAENVLYAKRVSEGDDE